MFLLLCRESAIVIQDRTEIFGFREFSCWCSQGITGTMEQHQETGDQHQATGGATAGERSGKHPSKTVGIRFPTARIPWRFPQDGRVCLQLRLSLWWTGQGRLTCCLFTSVVLLWQSRHIRGGPTTNIFNAPVQDKRSSADTEGPRDALCQS